MTDPIPSTLPTVPLPRRVPGATPDDSQLWIYQEVRAEFPGFNPDTITAAKSAEAMVAESYQMVANRSAGEPDQPNGQPAEEEPAGEPDQVDDLPQEVPDQIEQADEVKKERPRDERGRYIKTETKESDR